MTRPSKIAIFGDGFSSLSSKSITVTYQHYTEVSWGVLRLTELHPHIFIRFQTSHDTPSFLSGNTVPLEDLIYFIFLRLRTFLHFLSLALLLDLVVLLVRNSRELRAQAHGNRACKKLG